MPIGVDSPPRAAFRQTVVGAPRRASEAGDRRRSVCVPVATSTTGGVFELMFSLLPPRVVRRRSICQTD